MKKHPLTVNNDLLHDMFDQEKVKSGLVFIFTMLGWYLSTGCANWYSPPFAYIGKDMCNSKKCDTFCDILSFWFDL